MHRLLRNTPWPKRLAATSGFTAKTSGTRTLTYDQKLQSQQPIQTSTTWQDTAETLIIGGGVAGCSLAYHLARAGQKDVILLEKLELTSGSTWHAAGLTTTYHPGINLKKLHLYSMNMYSQMEAETGQGVGFHQCGSLRIATTPARVDEMKYQMSRQGWHDAPQCIVNPDQMQELVPIMNMDNILMGTYNPADGHIDPYSLTMAIAKGARMYGATLLQHCPVQSLRLREDGKWVVGTAQGEITANRVVNCAGFHAKEVHKMAGSDLPLVPIHHQYLVTSTVPKVKELEKEIPVLRHLEGSFYLRMERDGLLIGPYESAESMNLSEDWVRKGVDPGFGKELFQPDLDRLTPHLEVAMELVPCFQEANIQSVVNGPITYTPDILPLVGPDLLPNMWTAAGFGYGIVHGGGVGAFLTEWIMKGEPPFDLVECDVNRFGDWASDDFCLAKSRESYGMNNAIGYPHEERYAGRPTRRVSGAHKQIEQRGGHMDFHSGWEQPAWFANPGEIPEYKPSFGRTNWHDNVGKEVDLVMNTAGVIDLTPFSKFIVQGPQAAAFLDYVAANNIPKEGRIVISHMLTPGGKVMAELTITKTGPDTFLIITGSGVELHDLRWLKEQARLGDWDVSFVNVTEDLGVLSVAGPLAKDVMKALQPNFPDKFPFFSAKKVNLAGVDTTALRLSYSGELGWELYHPRAQTHTLYNAILDAGIPLGLGDFGTHAMNVLRLEKGFKGWGAEMNLDTTIVDAGLMPFVNMKKDFIGRTAVQEILKERPTKYCVMAEIDSPVDPRGNETIWLANKVVGNTTSGCFSYYLGKPLAFMYLPPLLTTPGTTVQVELMNELRNAKVLPGPPMETALARNKKKSPVKAKIAAKI